MSKKRLILIANPGSSSRKYALYDGQKLIVNLHFEYEDGKVVCGLKNAKGESENARVKLEKIEGAAEVLQEVLDKNGYLGGKQIEAVLIRIVAPGDYFTTNHLVDDECMKQLELAKVKTPLHAPVTAGEIEHFRKVMPEVKIALISDSAFHSGRPKLMKYYGFDLKLADEFEIKRYGYHGLSVGSIVHTMKREEILAEKVIVCHIGSGSSLSAVFRGESIDNSMGYSPLEGLIMATRTGSMDVAAALAVKKALKIKDDIELEKYLNKQAGLLGMSGGSDDMREVLNMRNNGDERASFAVSLYVHRIQSVIGQMAAAMNGVDAIVFTATIGERSDPIRQLVCQKLDYLGFEIDAGKNTGELKDCAEIQAAGSKLIYVIKTDETAQMIRQAEELLAER